MWIYLKDFCISSTSIDLLFSLLVLTTQHIKYQYRWIGWAILEYFAIAYTALLGEEGFWVEPSGGTGESRTLRYLEKNCIERGSSSREDLGTAEGPS